MPKVNDWGYYLNMKNYDDYMERKPGVCGGALVVKGTRVRVKVVLDSLAEGHSTEEIVASYPTLSLDSVRAIVAYARL